MTALRIFCRLAGLPDPFDPMVAALTRDMAEGRALAASVLAAAGDSPDVARLVAAPSALLRLGLPTLIGWLASRDVYPQVEAVRSVLEPLCDLHGVPLPPSPRMEERAVFALADRALFLAMNNTQRRINDHVRRHGWSDASAARWKLTEELRFIRLMDADDAKRAYDVLRPVRDEDDTMLGVARTMVSRLKRYPRGLTTELAVYDAATIVTMGGETARLLARGTVMETMALDFPYGLGTVLWAGDHLGWRTLLAPHTPSELGGMKHHPLLRVSETGCQQVNLKTGRVHPLEEHAPVPAMGRTLPALGAWVQQIGDALGWQVEGHPITAENIHPHLRLFVQPPHPRPQGTP
jgi:hypothetical protein